MEKTKQMVSVRECAKLTGLPYGWLLDQVLRGLNAPPSYQLPGHQRRLVIVEEVMEWAKREGVASTTA